MASQTGKKINSINILPDFSRSKDNQKITKFGQLIEYNVKNFLKKVIKKIR